MPDRPNILILVSEQHRGDCLGCEGHPVLLTPNMDAIRRSRLLAPGLVGPAAEGFRMLRTQVTQRMQQRGLFAAARPAVTTAAPR